LRPPHCLVVSGNQFSSKRYAIERRENSRVVLAHRRIALPLRCSDAAKSAAIVRD
jgi:hypothetical protein